MSRKSYLEILKTLWFQEKVGFIKSLGPQSGLYNGCGGQPNFNENVDFKSHGLLIKGLV